MKHSITLALALFAGTALADASVQFSGDRRIIQSMESQTTVCNRIMVNRYNELLFKQGKMPRQVFLNVDGKMRQVGMRMEMLTVTEANFIIDGDVWTIRCTAGFTKIESAVMYKNAQLLEVYDGNGWHVEKRDGTN